jgi:hypothetical protein
MKDAIVKVRIAEVDKSRLEQFANEAGKSASEIVRQAVGEAVRGHVAGHKRRSDIANLRRSINLMIYAFKQKPIDVSELTKVATKVCQDAAKVLT